MVDNFKAHDRKGGPRLEELQGLGRRGGIKFVDDVPEPAVRRSEVMSVRAPPLSIVLEAGARRLGPKVGRPRVEGVRPWDAAGVSRTEYYRRKAKGEV